MAPKRRSSLVEVAKTGRPSRRNTLFSRSERSKTRTPVRSPVFRNERRSGTSKRPRFPSRILSMRAGPDLSTQPGGAPGRVTRRLRSWYAPRVPPHGTLRRSFALPSLAHLLRPRGGSVSTFKELIRRVKSEIREVSVDEARKLGKGGAVLVDVREADEFSQGHVPETSGISDFTRRISSLKVLTEPP